MVGKRNIAGEAGVTDKQRLQPSPARTVNMITEMSRRVAKFVFLQYRSQPPVETYLSSPPSYYSDDLKSVSEVDSNTGFDGKLYNEKYHIMDNRGEQYAPLVRHEDSTDTEIDAYNEPRSGKKKFSQYRLVLTLAPFTIVMALGFIIIAGIFASWVLKGKANSKKESQIDIDQQGVGRLPFMGYNTWNSFACDIDEGKILNMARLMKEHGLIDVGYDHMNLDDCYSEKKRSPSGDIVANKDRFPSGMNSLTSKLHDLGLKAGIYSDSGWFTCQMYPGSYNNEDRDIKLFQDWGFDLLKYDNCAVPFDEIIREGQVGKFTRMSNAIKKLSKESGKPPILFSLCQWGVNQPWLWARRLGQSWRTTMDIYPEWNQLMNILNDNSFYASATDFYGHNDLDILEVGNGDLTYEEAKSHFTAWALMKSPLLISTDLSRTSEEILAIFKNKEIIAINQDPVVGTSIVPFRWGVNPDWTHNKTHPAQYWSGETQNGSVFMLLNTLDHPADMTFNLTESPWIRAGRQYSVRDLWTHTDNGTAVRSFTARNVPAHGVVALLLKDAGDEPAGTQPPCARMDWCTAENGTRVDGK